MKKYSGSLHSYLAKRNFSDLSESLTEGWSVEPAVDDAPLQDPERISYFNLSNKGIPILSLSVFKDQEIPGEFCIVAKAHPISMGTDEQKSLWKFEELLSKCRIKMQNEAERAAHKKLLSEGSLEDVFRLKFQTVESAGRYIEHRIGSYHYGVAPFEELGRLQKSLPAGWSISLESERSFNKFDDDMVPAWKIRKGSDLLAIIQKEDTNILPLASVPAQEIFVKICMGLVALAKEFPDQRVQVKDPFNIEFEPKPTKINSEKESVIYRF